ncbi:MAG: hypothetical protein EPO31_14360 [Gammaproteobacteria bacterium]|nr:MAG: hypothetical protein EPO31_14360 [Gammaproteobacteria bacterium]
MTDQILSNSTDGLIDSAFDLVSNEQRWKIVFHNISNFRNIEENWDGEGADTPSEVLISSMVRYLSLLKYKFMPPPDRTTISTDGAIIIEWQYPYYILELESGSPGRGEYMITNSDGSTSFHDVSWENFLDDNHKPESHATWDTLLLAA